MEKKSISGTFIYFDRINENGHMYKKEMAKEIIDQFNERIDNDQALGTLGYPSNPENFGSINLGEVSHKVVELHFNELKNSLDGTIEILETESGKKVKDLIMKNEKSPFVVRSRGYGNINENHEIENFKIISFDIIPADTDSFKKFNNEDINS
jgi:hypothetical protein